MDSECFSGKPQSQPPQSPTAYNNPSGVGTPVNDLLLPPSWTTTATDSATSFHSLVGFMQRRISDLVGATPSTDSGGSDAGFYDTVLPDQQIPQSSSSLVNEFHRAGLLQPRTYNGTSMSSFSSPPPVLNHIRPTSPLTRRDFQPTSAQSPLTTAGTPQPHTPISIRAMTVELSNMPFPASLPSPFATVDSSGQNPPSGVHHKPNGSKPSRLRVYPEHVVPADQTPLPSGPGGFIFPRAFYSPISEAHKSSPVISSSFGVSSPENESLKSSATSMSITSRSGTGDSSALDNSSLSIPPSSLSVTAPSSSESWGGRDGARRKEKQKEEESNLSGLSLSRPASLVDEEGTNDGASSSRSSSADPESRDYPHQQLSGEYPTFNPGQMQIIRPQITRQPQLPSPHIVADEWNLTTPTATPMGTPRAFTRPLPTSPTNPSPRYSGFGDRDVEKQKEGDEETGRPHVHGQGHIRWRSPLRVEHRGERYSNIRYDEQVEGRWESDTSSETTPLLGSQTSLTCYTSSADQVNGAAGGDSLLSKKHISWGFSPSFPSRLRASTMDVKAIFKKELTQLPWHGLTAVRAIPAVLLGCLLNILDGVSYGMIIFPTTGVFSELGPMGVSMFFVSTIASQLVYTLGGSGFAGANGSMMIEVVPFFHIMANSIADQIGEDDPLSIIATTLVAYAFSSVLTGLSFFLLGALKLGTVVGFFPRHILIGCIGGIGAFLIQTGLTVSLRISEDDFNFSLETLKYMFEIHNFILWAFPLLLAILLRFITHKFHHQLIFPLYFITVPAVFYVVVAITGFNLSDLRESRWIFNMGASAHEPWFKFYAYFDFEKVNYSVLWSTLPTQLALLFFNVLHPPLNVPALAVSLNDDVDTNKELVAHGYSNFLSGLLCSVPNYLVYVNTLLFYRVGGGNRIAGFLLAVATIILLIIGPWPIAYIPVMVVGALIYVLGIDLVKEALWDNRHRASWSEYITIISIMVMMTVWDFVVGVLFGITVCCIFFVIQNSQLRSIRAMYTGDFTMSAVRRPSLQRAYIREVSRQTTILRLQGFLFFGTITHVEETIRSAIEGPSWQQRPVQFLVLDLSLVGGIDMSSAEAFVRIHRVLSARCVTLVFCGFEVDSPIGRALSSVEVLGQPGVELFSTFNDAMEWTENSYLHAWFKSQKINSSAFLTIPSSQEAEYNQLVGSLILSPRRSHIRDAGERTIATEILSTVQPDMSAEPHNTLRKAFSSYGDPDPAFFQTISEYMDRVTATSGMVLWRQGEQPNGLYVIESGVLRALYTFANPMQQFEESMVAGTLAGELSALAEAPRNATVTVEHGPAVLWKISGANLEKLQIEEPELARVFIQLVLKAAKLDYDILLAAIASRQ